MGNTSHEESSKVAFVVRANGTGVAPVVARAGFKDMPVLAHARFVVLGRAVPVCSAHFACSAMRTLTICVTSQGSFHGLRDSQKRQSVCVGLYLYKWTPTAVQDVEEQRCKHTCNGLLDWFVVGVGPTTT